jgi:DNA-binding MarR family transcriptional regulator
LACDLLVAVAMHAIIFGTKRAFHAALRMTRKPLQSMGLTAARFDLLSALLSVEVGRKWVRHIHQSDLRRMLGVTASVVSRMLRSLERLGLVTRRRPDYGDRRQRQVNLTERGRTCIRDARRMLMRAVGRMVCEAICFGRHHDAGRRLVRLDTLEGYLGALREYFGDAATLYYRWGHPDD